MLAGRLERLWADYEEHHRTAGNKYCHLVGIPLIVASLLGLLAIPLFSLGGARVELALVLIMAAGGVYLSLDRRLGAAMMGALLLLYLGARLLPWPVNAALFVLGWILQVVGHGVYEKRSPAFFRNLAHLLVGPLWVLNQFVRVKPPIRQAQGRVEPVVRER